MFPTPHSILYEDADCIAIDKPPGIAVHPSALLASGEEALLAQLRRQLGYRIYPLHRLDRATSGVLLFAKHPAAAAALSERWRLGQVAKVYLALCRGWTPESLSIERPLASLDAPDKAPQEAKTLLWRLAQIAWPVAIETYPETRFSLVALRPLSGRRHQLRRHLRFLNHPLIGDSTYGRGAFNRYFRENFAAPRLFLHHAALSWPDRTGQQQSVIAPLDDAWQRVLAAFGWSPPASEQLRLFLSFSP